MLETYPDIQNHLPFRFENHGDGDVSVQTQNYQEIYRGNNYNITQTLRHISNHYHFLIMHAFAYEYQNMERSRSWWEAWFSYKLLKYKHMMKRGLVKQGFAKHISQILYMLRKIPNMSETEQKFEKIFNEDESII
jgi:hypothetical protein